MNKLKILIISPYSIFPPIHGGAVRVFHLIQELSRQHQISVLAWVRNKEEQQSNQALQQYCRSTSFLIKDSSPKCSLLGVSPAGFDEFYSQKMEFERDRIIVEDEINILQIEYSHMSRYLLKSPQLGVFLTFHELAFVSKWRHMKKTSNPLAKLYYLYDCLRLVRHELRICKQADRVFTMSAHDSQILRSKLPGFSPRISSQITIGVDINQNPRQPRNPQRKSLLFVGNLSHLPNVDGILFFYHEVLPLIRSQRKDLLFYIVGAEPPHEIFKMQEDPNTIVTGQVEHIDSYFQEHTVFVAPIRVGSGVKLKILEALGARIPIVSTTLGAEGIDVTNRENILLADSPSDFARCVLNLLENPDLCQKLADNGHLLVKKRYNYQIIAQNLTEEYRRLLMEKRDLDKKGV